MKALAASTPRSCPHDAPRFPIPAGIQDVILLKNRLRRQWQFTRDPLWKLRSAPCKGRWPTSWMGWRTTSGVRHLNLLIPKTNPCGGWPNGWWEFLLHLLIVTPRAWRVTLSSAEKAEALAESLKSAQFRPLMVPLVPAVTEMVDVALMSCFLTPVSEPQCNQRKGGSRSHHGSQVRQESGPEWYSELDFEASSPASCIPPCPDF